MNHLPFADIKEQNLNRPAYAFAWTSDEGTTVGVSYGQFPTGKWGLQLLVGTTVVRGRVFNTPELAHEAALGLVRAIGSFIFADALTDEVLALVDVTTRPKAKA